MRTSFLLVLSSLSLISLATGPALAQSAADNWAPPETTLERPTSGRASLLSGRTNGTGETLIAGALGWPGLWAQVELAPDPNFAIGARVGVVYGSPVMGLVAGVGGELMVPMRIHVFAEGQADLSVRIAPEVSIGQGILFGEQASAARLDQLGVSSRIELGAVLGFSVSEQVTLVFMANVAPGLSFVETERVHAIGLFTAAFGVEALMSRDTMLFGLLEGGAGAADGGGRAVAYFPQVEILRLSLGIAYLL